MACAAWIAILTKFDDLEEEAKSERRRLRPSRVRKKDLDLPRERKMCSDSFNTKQLNAIYEGVRAEEERLAKELESQAARASLPTIPAGRGACES